MKNFCFFAITLVSIQGYSQSHTQFWMKTTMRCNLNTRLSSSIEWHHRTQSLANTESPFRYPLMNALRLWIDYKINSRHALQFSPYSFFSNDPVMNQSSDIGRQNINEHRIWMQYESRIPLKKQWTWINRNGAEYRIFEANTALCRVRIREGISHALNKELSLAMYDEVFVNTINSSSTHLFDQNRLGLQANYTIDKHMKLDFGTNLIHQKLRNVEVIYTSYVFFFNVLYTL